MYRALGLAWAGALLAASAAPAADVAVSAVLIKLIDQVEVPARVAGVLERVTVREGQMVEAGALLAQIEDEEPRHLARRGELEWQAAKKQADNDVKVRFANKSLEVAQAELKRAQESAVKVATSVSRTELDHLALVVEKSTLEIEQARLDAELAGMAARLKEHEAQAARRAVDRRRITAPLAGVVAQVAARRGEWVEPGERVVRIVRVDRLRAEGLLSLADLRHDLRSATVTVKVPQGAGPEAEFPGKIVFVSPEVDPVSGQARVWAEIDNPQLRLRAGQRGSMTIHVPGPRAAVESR